MKKYLFIGLVYFLPLVAEAKGILDNIWKGAKCGGAEITTGGPQGPCNFCDGVVVASNIITYAVQLAVLLAVAMIVYGGVLIMTSAGDDNKLKEGRSRIVAAIVGLVVALAAWLIVNEIFHLLSGGGTSIPWSQVKC